MGVFNAANQWKIAVLFLPSLIGQVILPVISEQYALQNHQAVKKILVKTFFTYAVIATPILVFTSLFSSLIMGSYGKDFKNSWPVFVMLQLAVFTQVLTAPGVKYLEAAGRMWMNFYLNIGWSAILLAFTYSLVKKGAFGVALAQFFAFVAFAVGLYIYCFLAFRKQSANSFPIESTSPPFFSS